MHALPVLLELQGETINWGPGEARPAGQPRGRAQDAPPTMAWVPFYLLSLLVSTGQCGPGPRGAPGPSAWLSLEGPPPSVGALSLACLSVCRPLCSACADPTPVCVLLPGRLGQAHLHPEQWLQQLLCGLAPEGPREGSPFPDASGHQWCCWIQGDGISDRFSGSGSGLEAPDLPEGPGGG